MLTRSGLGAAVAAVTLAVSGWWWRYEELVVAAACLVTAVVFSLIGSRLGGRLQIERRIPNPRVARGDDIHLLYRVQNRTRRSAAGGTIRDRCDGSVTSVAVPSLARLTRLEVPATIATRRRGVFSVGPSQFERLDVLGLAVGRRAFGSTGDVFVHPRVHPIAGPSGEHHPVDSESALRRAASDPLSGFVSLRAYVDGDDPRMIHWPTTARMGTMMVREHVELRRPSVAILLDTLVTAASPDDFEEMVDVAASIAVHALQHGVEVRLHTTNPGHPGSPDSMQQTTQVLDVLTPVGQSAIDHTLDGSAVIAELTRATRVIVVTGPTGPAEGLRRLVSDRVSTVRIGAGATESGAAFAATDAQDFAVRWHT